MILADDERPQLHDMQTSAFVGEEFQPDNCVAVAAQPKIAVKK